MWHSSYLKNKQGFSLVESIVAIAIFVLLSGIIYQTSALLTKGVGSYRESVTISNLASQYMEIVHNLPYSSVGTVKGNPHGTLPDKPSNATTTVNNSDYQIYYVVNYIDNPADGTAEAGTDFAANDYKQVKLYVKNLATEKTYTFSTNITPRGLENLDSGGALMIEVFDAFAQPVPNASVHITNQILSPSIDLTRTTDSSGNLIEVGLPNSVNGYHIAVTKNGYSSDQTYPITMANPDPVKTDSTIANGQITQISFAIDKLSNLSFDTLNQNCEILPGIGMSIHGEKLIGNPNILKFDNDFSSNTSGKISLGSIEWDNYVPNLTDNDYIVYGSSPIQQVSVLPDTDQNYTLILGPKTTNSLLVIVKDSATGNPIQDATVQLINNNPTVDEAKITGGSVWASNNWTGGNGQADFIDATKYFTDDVNISTDIIPEALRLLSYDGGTTYSNDGTLISSTFDTATASTSYTTLTWQPTSQNPETSVKFQIATAGENTATTTWNFTGPDGTAESFYLTSGITINSPSARYVRYKVFLHTDNPNKTPVLTSININYVSGCFTPGQVFFSGLSADDSYALTISADNYTEQTITDLDITGNQSIEINLSQI